MRGRTALSIAAFCLLAGLGAIAPAAAASRAQVDPALLAGMEARSIGPAGMSGRVAAIDSVVSDPRIVYVGAATGGVWKSVNGGLSWEPIFDDQPVAAIGAVAVNQSIPDIVWVGTGEGNPRNSVSVGNGIYRSMDGGRTWSHLGLDKTERIHRILLHPSDPETAWVAALGQAWGENAERGVFKTTDGGKTWRKALYVDERTGAADLVIDPGNPDKLMAAMWDYRRWPWFFRSGGPGSGLYISHDGGETWQKRTPEDGLPEGDLGRIGLAISPADPRLAYALVESKKEIAIYGSGDGGETWARRGADENAGNRPFYFADIHADPEWPDRLYSLWSSVSVSDDGGRGFRVLVPFRAVHPDHHALWIDPRDGNRLILGNDGGVAFSEDRGETWRFVANLPLAQYYHVRVDDDLPYNVYGGMQDNGSWRGPSAVWENGGIRNHHWQEVDFGDGFETMPHPDDSATGYSMSQEGYLRRWDVRTGEKKDIRPAPPAGETLRFNWNAGLAQDPFDADTIYFGSQYLHMSRDRGDTWKIISPDLTTDNAEWQKQAESGGLTPDVTGAENFTTIIAIEPSPVQRGVLWVGTDDGRLHITRDGGETWTSVEKSLKGVPASTWIPHVAASPYEAGTAFVVLDNHRRSDLTPYLYRTDDFGRTWKSLATDSLSGYALVLRQDPVEPDLLYLGTEFGLWISLDAGSSWMKWTHGVPTVSVMDLVVHPREHDLVLATHGRAAFILDDIRPLRTLSREVMDEPLHLFPVPDARQYRVQQTGASRFPGNGEFRGRSRPYGALITFSARQDDLPHPDDEIQKARKEAERAEARLSGKSDEADKEAAEEPEAPAGRRGRRGGDGPKAKITIYDDQGDEIRTFDEPVKLGVNRVVWDLRRNAFRRPGRDDDDFFGRGGPEVLPGSYRVKVEVGESSAETSIRVLADPRFDIPRADREAKDLALRQAGRLQETVADAVKRITDTRSDIELALKRAPGEPEKEDGAEDQAVADLKAAAKELKKSLDAMEKRLWTPPDTKGIVAEEDVFSKARMMTFSLGSSWDAPTPAQMTQLGQVESRLRDTLTELNALYDEKVADFRKKVDAAGIRLLAPAEPLKVQAD